MPDEISIRPTRTEERLGYEGGAADLDGDGVPEIVVTAVTGWSTTTGAQTGYVAVFPRMTSSGESTDAALWNFAGDEENCAAGSSLLLHDVNGDGQVDLQVGAGSRTVDGVQWAGTLYTILGPLDATLVGDLEGVANARLVGEAYNDSVGERAYTLGDLDGDGISDFGTGYEYASWAGSERTGVARIFASVPLGTSAADDVAVATIYGAHEYDELGADGAGVDLDGDGLSDLVLGAQGYDSGLSDGAALVFFGPVTGTMSGDDADVVLYAEGAVQYAGMSVDAAGDVNDDGLDDILVGAPFAGDGAGYIVWGSAGIDTRSLSDADVTFRASEADAHTGHVVRGLGDLDGDGAEDVFLSDGPNNDASGYVFFGPFDVAGTHRTADADITLTADHEDGIYATAFNPGDATGDGVSDLVVGSYKNGTETSDGAVFIMDGTGL